MARPKGALNKNNQQLRDMITQALDKAGGVKYLTKQAMENPGPFMSLIGKILPKTIQGDSGNPVCIMEMSRDKLIAIAAGDGK